MKIARTIGLATVLATALVALLGAGQALAAETTLCKTSTVSPYCESGDRYAAKTAVEASSANVKISFKAFGVKLTMGCASSSLKGEATAQTGKPLPFDVTTWTLTGCGTNKEMSNCTVTTQDVGAEGSLLWTAGSNGTATLYGSKHAEKWYVLCNLGVLGKVDCKYTFKPTATFEGGSPAHLAVQKTTPSSQESGTGVCGSETAFEAVSYEVTSPKPSYVARAEAPPTPTTQLCKVNQEPCSEANIYPQGTLINASSSNFEVSVLMFGSTQHVTCKEASTSIETKAANGYWPEGLPLELKSLDLSGCKWPLLGSCEVKTSITEPTGSIAWLEGTLDGLLGGSLRASWQWTCTSGGGTYKCQMGTYLGSNVTRIEGGNPAKFKFPPIALNEDGNCPNTMQSSGDFTVNSPAPLYVTK